MRIIIICIIFFILMSSLIEISLDSRSKNYKIIKKRLLIIINDLAKLHKHVDFTILLKSLHANFITNYLISYDLDKNNKTSEKIKGLVLLNPALNTSILDREIPDNIEERRKKLWLFVKKLFDSNFEKFSPSNYIRKDLPPSIILHGDSDKTIPIEIIEKFSNDMIEKGNMVKFLKWDNKGHQFYRWDKEAYPEVISELIKFMKEN